MQAMQNVNAARDAAEPAPGDPGHRDPPCLGQPGSAAAGGRAGGEGSSCRSGSSVPHAPEPRRINMIEAIRRTLEVELAVNPRCLVFGEDVGQKGGVHAATLGPANAVR